MADLRAPRAGAAPRSGSINAWLSRHPAALAFVDEWLDLRARGETLWSINDIRAELTNSHGMPPFGSSGFRGWLERTRPEKYRAGR